MVEEAKRGSSRLLTGLRWTAFAACVLLFVHALAGTDLASAWGRIEAVGPLALLVVLPFPAALAMDAWAWKGLHAALGRSVSWSSLFKVRIATEAVTNSAPAGPILADAISPVLVSRRTGVPAVDVFAAATAKRWTVVRMHSTYVALCTAFGASTVMIVSRSMFGSDVLLVLVLCASLALMLLSIAIEAIAARGQVAGRLSRMLGRFQHVKAWIEERRHHFAKADQQLAYLSKDRRAGAAAAWRMLGLWLIEGFESYVIFRLLGAQMTLTEIFAFDAMLSVVRSTAMFAPAGIGVQDVGYLAVLHAYGVPDAAAIGPAFIVLKRLKEAFWIVIGFVMLARSGSRDVLLHPAKTAAAAEE